MYFMDPCTNVTKMDILIPAELYYNSKVEVYQCENCTFSYSDIIDVKTSYGTFGFSVGRMEIF